MISCSEQKRLSDDERRRQKAPKYVTKCIILFLVEIIQLIMSFSVRALSKVWELDDSTDSDEYSEHNDSADDMEMDAQEKQERPSKRRAAPSATRYSYIHVIVFPHGSHWTFHLFVFLVYLRQVLRKKVPNDLFVFYPYIAHQPRNVHAAKRAMQTSQRNKRVANPLKNRPQ